jgi:hypothetical protein
MASENTNPLASLASLFCLSLTDPFYILGMLFSDLASENSELLTSLASVLKRLIHTSDVLITIATTLVVQCIPIVG